MPSSFPLPGLSRGINRFEREARQDQCVEGMDVINDDGDLRRRDAYLSLATAIPHHFPTDRCKVKYQNGATFFTSANRQFVLDPSTTYLYIGCSEEFSGFDISSSSRGSNPTLTQHKVLNIQYSTGSGTWAQVPFFLDTTFHIADGEDRGTSLARAGRVAWHTEQLEGWIAATVDSVSLYWLRIQLQTTDELGTFGFPDGNISIDAPGFRVFEFSPVNCIFPYRDKFGRDSVLVGSDRPSPEGLEFGAALGVVQNWGERTRELYLVDDEGAGIFGVVTWPQHQQLVAGIWTNQGAPAVPTDGTANKLTKNFRNLTTPKRPDDFDYGWINSQFSGGILAELLSPSVSSTISSFVTVNLPSVQTDRYKHCIIYCSTGGGGGPATGECAEITSHTSAGGATTFQMTGFSAAPVVGNLFSIRMPASRLIINGDEREYQIADNDENTVTFAASAEYTAGAPNDIAQSSGGTGLCFWQVARQLRWSIRSGRWSACFNPGTNRLLLVNGNSPLLTFDGSRLRTAEADTTSGLVEALFGVNFDDVDAGAGQSPRAIVKSQLRAVPPTGKFICDFANRVVIAGMSSRPHDVVYSFPGTDDIWPLGYTGTIRDAQNDPITGIAGLNDQLVVFTDSAIHASDPPDENGKLSFRPVAQGIGFSSHWAVCKIVKGGSSALIGPNADGVYIYNGAEPVAVLDDWKRLVPVAPSTADIAKSSACVLRQRGWYVLAVGDYIFVYDYERGAWWVWSAPYGVSAMATRYDAMGKEQLLIGTNDGFIQTMVEGAYDEYVDEIEGYAKSVPIQPGQGNEVEVQAMMLTMKALGTKTLNANLYVNRQKKAWQEAELKVQTGEAALGAFTLGTSKLARDQFKTVRLNTPSGTKAHSIQYEFSGTSPWRVREAEVILAVKGRRGR
jgi:hypothetical protein